MLAKLVSNQAQMTLQNLGKKKANPRKNHSWHRWNWNCPSPKLEEKSVGFVGFFFLLLDPHLMPGPPLENGTYFFFNKIL